VLASDAGSGLLSRLRVMSVPRIAVISGRAAADGVRSLLSLAVVLAVGFAAGMRFERGVLPGLVFVALALVFSLTVSAGAGAVGLRLANPEATSSLLGLPWLPLLMLSTAFVPADQFPSWLEPIVAWSPISATIDGLRALITDGASLTPLWRALGWQAVLLPLFLALAARAYRRAS
jgi:ABC-2 type transport system permease protein